LPTIPIIYFFRGLVFLVAIPFLNFSFELVALTVDDIKIVISELTPLFFDLALYLFPIALYPIPIHVVTSLLGKFNDRKMESVPVLRSVHRNEGGCLCSQGLQMEVALKTFATSVALLIISTASFPIDLKDALKER
jgi:hypothetical protein